MANPALKDRFINVSDGFNSLEETQAMTINGTILKTCFLFLLMIGTFAYTWYLQINGFTDKCLMLYNGGLFGGLILGLAICFLPKNKWLMITTPVYAMCEGLMLGYFSAIANKFYPGIVAQATTGTFLVMLSMLALFAAKIIKCTDTLRAVVANSIFAIFGIYLLQFILGFFGINIPGLFSNGAIGIGFSIFVVAIASFRLFIDFADITQFSSRVDKNYEWYFGFSLMVTVVWLYIEILNLLMKLQSRNN